MAGGVRDSSRTLVDRRRGGQHRPYQSVQRTQIADAVQAGATLSTHLGNGAHAVLPRHPNYIWDQLAEDRLAASFIVDGIHLAPSLLESRAACQGHRTVGPGHRRRDAGGMRAGPYKLGEVDVELACGWQRPSAGRHAPGRVGADDGSRHLNCCGSAGVKLRDAITMATRNPARVGRIATRLRGLAPGERADLVRFRFHPEQRSIEILETNLSGQQVYTK